MSSRRDREPGKLEEPIETAVDRLPWPGKGSRTAGSRGAEAWPGKRAPSQELKLDLKAGALQWEADARTALDTLAAAIASRDVEQALGAASALRRALDLVRKAVTHVGRERVRQLESAAAPLLAKAPSISEAAFRERFGASGRTQPAWEAETAAWRASLGDPDAAAGRGVAGGGHALPFQTQIQASFGRHDVSAIRAHTDDGAREATHELGAIAYATGSDVAFADGNPELHTVAHEAAHVIQQRDGVSFKGAGGDPTLEAHADAVADAVVAGTSAEPLLDAFAGRAAHGVVQRKDSPTRSEPNGATGDEYTLPDSIEAFAIAPDGWSALVRTKWVAVDPKQRLFEMLQQMQRLGAFTWAKEEGLRRAAEKTPAFDGNHDVVRYVVTLRTLAQMGLPPLSGAMVAREGDNLIVALKVPGVREDDQKESHALGFDDSNMVYHAVEKFTNLTATEHPHFDRLVIRDGIVEVQIPDKQAAEMFGAKQWSDWKNKRGTAAANDGGAPADRPADVSSELSFSEKMRVEGWLEINLNLVDSGPVTHIDRNTLNVIEEIEKSPDLKPILKQLVERKTKAPGQVVGTFALEELLEAAKTERDRHRLGTDKLDQGETTPLDPSEKVWNIDGRIVQKGLVFAGRGMTFTLELDWETWKTFRSADDIDKFAKRGWHDEIEWAVERIDKPDTPVAVKQSHNDSSHIALDHTFALGPGEKSGQFKVHAFMRSTHFAPKHFATVIEVKTEEARMAELRARDLGDMMTPDTKTESYKFDIGTAQKVLDVGGKIAGAGAQPSEDTHGSAFSGALPKDLKHADPAERLKGRQDELELQKKVAAYLRKQTADGKPGYTDALQAAEQRIKFLEETEKKLAGDESSGWKPFEVHGTYLSRNADVPSGALDLYGSFKISTASGQVSKFEILIRDLSNKIESDLEFKGDGDNFDDALREAFVKLAKAYPDGKVSVLAEEIARDGVFHGKPNGRSIGYELATTSAWKRVKSVVFDPVVQILTNAAAMAIVIIFPPSAAVIVPMLAVADIVNNVDDMVDKHDKGKLTFKGASIDLLQIGLDVLPAARGAKVLNPAKKAVQEAKGMANMRFVLFDAVQLGGQFIVMYERTKEQLVDIQDKQISVMAYKYRALIDLEKQVAEHRLNPSDPQLQQKRAEIEGDAKAIRDTVTSTWTMAVQHQATFFVGSHLVGGHDAAAAGAQANKDTHFERDVPREITSLRKTAANKFETEAQNLRVIHAHYEGEGVHTSAIEYDHANGTSHFEITDKTTGSKTRVEAPIGHVMSFAELHGATNQVVGHPVDKMTGLELLEKLNRGDASALKEVGITDVGTGKLPRDREFGIGELPHGEVVLVTGEPNGVDWAHLPGLKPRAHTHPPSVHEIPVQDDGSHRVPLAELVKPKPDPYIPREVVFPTGADVIVMAHLGVDAHVVVTGFALRDGVVAKAPDNDNGPRLIFTIVGAHEVGEMPDGRYVYKTRVVGRSGTETPVDHDVWVIAQPSDENGNLYMSQPPGVILHEPGQPRMPRDAAATTGAERGAPKAPLTSSETSRKQALAKNWRELGETELGELVKLRERNGETTYDPDTPEHKLRLWNTEKATEPDKEFSTWSPAYHRNATSAKIATIADPSSSAFGKLVYAVYEARQRGIDEPGFHKSNEAKELFGDLAHISTADAAALSKGYAKAVEEIESIKKFGETLSMGDEELRAFLHQRNDTPGTAAMDTMEAMKAWHSHKDSGVPFGFKDAAEFEAFQETATADLRRALKKTDPKAEAFLQGSALSGVSYSRHLPFDHDSDLDIAVVSPYLMKQAKTAGAEVSLSPKRIGPLEEDTIKELGLDKFVRDLEAITSKDGQRPREVGIMLFENQESMTKPIGSSKESTRPAKSLRKP